VRARLAARGEDVGGDEHATARVQHDPQVVGGARRSVGLHLDHALADAGDGHAPLSTPAGKRFSTASAQPFDRSLQESYAG